MNEIPIAGIGPQVFSESSLVVIDECIGGIQDIAG